MNIYRGHEELERFDDLHTDLDDPLDQRSWVGLQLARLACQIERLKLARMIVVFLTVGLVLGAAYLMEGDPVLIIKELLAGVLKG